MDDKLDAPCPLANSDYMGDFKQRCREPQVEDGPHIAELIQRVGTLDVNSTYCYLMVCKYFYQTSVVVERDHHIVGFLSGFCQPDEPDVLFVWQVAVDPAHQGRGLGSLMLNTLLDRPACKQIRFIEATVTPSNQASVALFQGMAHKWEAYCQVSDCFSADLFAGKSHEPERLFRIGPLREWSVSAF